MAGAKQATVAKASAKPKATPKGVATRVRKATKPALPRRRPITRSLRAVPFAIEVPDRARKERYYDPEFYALEAEQLWPRVVADGLPARGDPRARRLRHLRDPRPVGHRRPRAPTARCRRSRTPAATAACGWSRDRGNCDERLHLLVPRLVLRPATARTPRIPMRKSFDQHNLERRRHRPHPGPLRAVGRLRVDQPRRRARRRCASAIEPAATILDAWKVESLRAEWWYACRLPVNWKLAEQAFQEQYHVVQSHPQLVIPGMRYVAAAGATFNPRAFVDAEIQYLRTMSEGMAGMFHANDVAVAEGLRDIDLPDERRAGGGDLEPHAQRRGRRLAPRQGQPPSPTSTSSRPRARTSRWATASRTTSCCRCTAARRPTGSARSGRRRRSWRSGRSPGSPRATNGPARPPPEVWEYDDARWPPIPAQDFSNLPAPAAGAARRRASSTCACPRRPRATSRTSSGRSTASSPAAPTTSCSRAPPRGQRQPAHPPDRRHRLLMGELRFPDVADAPAPAWET